MGPIEKSMKPEEFRLLKAIVKELRNTVEKAEGLPPVLYLVDRKKGHVQEANIFTNAGPKQTVMVMKMIADLIQEKQPDMFLLALEVWTLDPEHVNTYEPGQDLSTNQHRKSMIMIFTAVKGGAQWAALAEHTQALGLLGKINWTKDVSFHPLHEILEKVPSWTETHSQKTHIKRSEE